MIIIQVLIKLINYIKIAFIYSLRSASIFIKERNRTHINLFFFFFYVFFLNLPLVNKLKKNFVQCYLACYLCLLINYEFLVSRMQDKRLFRQGYIKRTNNRYVCIYLFISMSFWDLH